MATCPAGHESTATDYCDVCGEPIGAAPSPAPVPAPSAAPAAGDRLCPSCGVPGTGRFCEACGFDTALPAPPPPAPAPPAAQAEQPAGDPATGPAGGWVAVVRADGAWYERSKQRNGPDIAAITFPAYYPERRFPLIGPEMLIGKRDDRNGIAPQIDLRINPEDLGISRSQAILRETPDGGWEVIDIGSTNGTTLDDSDTPLVEFTPAALTEGSRIHIGAWTTITVTRSG